MKKVFADTGFWFALANVRDNLHFLANQLHEEYVDALIVTTDECLVEFLALMSAPNHRRAALALLDVIRVNNKVVIEEQSRDSFNRGLEEYRKLTDKECSLVDCISFVTMREKDISNALAHDHHFTQAGFISLMRIQ